MNRPKEYKYQIKKYTRYNGEVWYECTYSNWLERLLCLEYHLFYSQTVVRFAGIVIEQVTFPTLEDVKIAIDKHKADQLKYVQNQIKSVEVVKLPEPWKNRLDKDMVGRGYQPHGGGINDLGSPPVIP